MTTNGNIGWIASYIWGIANDVLRDLYVRGKYRDVILPMTVLRRLDAVLEDTKQAVLEMKASLDAAGVVAQDQALRHAAGQAFYNTSRFTLRDFEGPGEPPAAQGRPAVGRTACDAHTTGEHIVTEIIFEIVEDEVDGGYSASALGYGIHTQGDSIEEVRANVKEAVDCYFDDSMTRPKLIRLHFVRDEVLVA